jgi:hypothetical protein
MDGLTNIAWLNADGSFDVDFLAGQPGPDWGVSSLLPQDDGKILITGGWRL